MSLLRACRPVLWLVSAILFASACGGGNDGGPPRAPCSDDVKLHAPVCGTPCKAACGCKGCSDGEMRDIDGAMYVCQANCYTFVSGPIDGGTGGSAGSAGSSGADSGPDCDAVACDPASICGQCQNACGCCDPCVENEQQVIDGSVYTCVAGCYQLTA